MVDGIISKTKNALIIFQCFVILFIFYQIYFWWDSINDDSFISFRYAKNVIKGYGLVYNEGERVEGYSNFLWIILLIPFALFDADLFLISKILSLIFILGILIILGKVRWSNNNIRINQLLRYSSFAILFLMPGFIYHCLSGLETAFFTFMTILSLTSLMKCMNNNDINSRKNYKNILFIGILFGIIGLIRTDGFVMVFGSILYLFTLKFLEIKKKLQTNKNLIKLTFFFHYWFFNNSNSIFSF